MTTFDYSNLQARADALHASAKSETLRLNGERFTFAFNHRDGVYDVAGEDGVVFKRYNTRKLATARQWLREYYA